LSADVTVDIFCGVAALIHYMRQDMTAATLRKRDKVGGKMYG
jgi:hypothetical protein